MTVEVKISGGNTISIYINKTKSGHGLDYFGRAVVETELICPFPEAELNKNTNISLLNRTRSVFIDGLDEAAMAAFWRKACADKNPNVDEYFKGTRHMGKDKSKYAFFARLLKQGIPSDIDNKVHIGVKFRWTAHDVMNYADAIAEALHRISRKDSSKPGFDVESAKSRHRVMHPFSYS